MKERHLREEHLLVCQNTKGFLGVMSDFVKYPQEIQRIVDNQLGHVIVADTLIMLLCCQKQHLPDIKW